MPKILYFDAFSGIAGDMTVSALSELGVSRVEIKKAIRSLRSGIDISFEDVEKKGINATQFSVSTEKGFKQPHRDFKTIRKIINGSSFNKKTKELSTKIFAEVARAEAKVHKTTIDKVHFHEVGAIDSIADTVLTAYCISKLSPDKIVFSPLPLGSGFVKCAHGKLPVPVPAVAEIVKGMPVYTDGRIGELVTPTGAAIAKVLADEFGPIPEMNVKKIGCGAGTRESDVPNVLRVMMGTYTDSKDTGIVEINTNIDDMTPEGVGYLFDKLVKSSTLDVTVAPVKMKKNRPGFLLSVLCTKEDVNKLSRIILFESSTFGIRFTDVDRKILDRKFKKVKTKYGIISVKTGIMNNKVLKSVPEYEDCKRAAEKHKVPFKKVYEEAMRKGK